MVDKFERLVQNYERAISESTEAELLLDNHEYLFWISDKNSQEIPRPKLMKFYLDLLELTRRYQIEEPRSFEVLNTICKRLSQRLNHNEMYDRSETSLRTYRKFERSE
jgi:hypothetical protein